MEGRALSESEELGDGLDLGVRLRKVSIDDGTSEGGQTKARLASHKSWCR